MSDDISLNTVRVCLHFKHLAIMDRRTSFIVLIYIHACIHTYLHTYLHTYIHTSYLELLSLITTYPLLQKPCVTSNEFGAILNILEGLSTSRNTVASPK